MAAWFAVGIGIGIGIGIGSLVRVEFLHFGAVVMSYGRRRILTDETEISTENVIAEVDAAFLVHSDNRAEVEKLYQYYRNKTDTDHKPHSHAVPNFTPVATHSK